jgi:hypothetical protein
VRTRQHGAVQIASPEVHRVLSYLVALDRQGYAVSAQELDAFAEQPDQRPAEVETVLGGSSMTAIYKTLAAQFTREVEPAEAMSAHFQRLQWARQGPRNRLEVTDLGRALHRALEQESISEGTVVEVLLEQDDPTSLARALDRIARKGPAMLVEPYFRLDQLLPVIQITEVTRVLCGSRTKAQEREALRLAVEGLRVVRPFEVRVSDDLHDRYVVPDAGPVMFIGSSLNGLGVHPTVLGELADTSDSVRSLYEDAWKVAQPLARAEPEPGDHSSGDTDVTQQSGKAR